MRTKSLPSPCLDRVIFRTTATPGKIAELKAPSVDGRFLKYQWYKNGSPKTDANSSTYTIDEFNATRDSGEYEIRISNDFAVLKTKAILNENDSAILPPRN